MIDIVAFVGVISNIYTVCHKVIFLGWICTLPKEVVGIISVSMSLIEVNVRSTICRVSCLRFCSPFS